MIGRRSMIGTTTLGSMVAALLPAPTASGNAEPAAQQASEKSVEDVAAAIDRLRAELQKQQTFWELEPVRQQQKTFLRAASKLPDYLEVGVDIWQQVYDWHVRYQQPMTISRDNQGRLTIMVMSTMVIMRSDLTPAYVGLPYDNR
jgi:hypothetical protein